MDDQLHPPRKSGELDDTDKTESSDGSDQFVDAAEESRAQRSMTASPIPITRVERVDDTPTYGEVPGTAAYKLRTADAVPDEVEIVPDGQRSRSHSRLRPEDRPTIPAVPKIIAEKIDPDVPAYGDVPGTAAFEMRRADAQPDEIIRSPDSATGPPDPWNSEFMFPSPLASSEQLTGQGSPTESSNRSSAQRQSFEGESDVRASDSTHARETSNHHTDVDEEEDGFGDDFDEFEEGQEGDDFGEFDDGFQEEDRSRSQPPPPVSISLPAFPILDYSNLDNSQAIAAASQSHIRALFPSTNALAEPTDLPPPTQQIFLSDRSLSLYTQLIAPPPLAPPDWLRSRIRRLFLVSLGVPVDLDEILPASKQKKLILPSIHLNPPTASDARSPRGSTESRGASSSAAAVSRLKGRNESSASVDSRGGRRRRKDEPVEPQLDLSEAVRVAETTEVRLQGMSDEELNAHVDNVQALVRRAEEALLYWQSKRESAVKEKEAFEGVIENLVRHARKVRK